MRTDRLREHIEYVTVWECVCSWGTEIIQDRRIGWFWLVHDGHKDILGSWYADETTIHRQHTWQACAEQLARRTRWGGLSPLLSPCSHATTNSSMEVWTTTGCIHWVNFCSLLYNYVTDIRIMFRCGTGKKRIRTDKTNRKHTNNGSRLAYSVSEWTEHETINGNDWGSGGV